MSFPRYPDYKDSGVAWLGLVPEHWIVIPLKRDIEFVTSGARGWAENYADDGDLFLRIGNLTRDSIRLDLSDTQRVVVPDGAEVDRTQVQAGDILFSITAYLGSVAVVPAGLGRAFVSQHVALVRPSKKHCLSEWLAYVAISYVGKTHLETTGYGGTKVQLSLADVTSLPIIVPPIDEQQAIATFLDRETAKIDALVAEQEKLIALLQEKRQAVISHAVTKGLDPSVPMKDSGVEWLGEVPGHWEVKRLKQLCDEPLKYGANEAAELDDPSLPRFVRITDVTESGALRDETFRSLPREIAEPFLLREGDVLLARSGGTVGKSFMYQRHWGEACFAGYLIRVRLSQRLCVPQWLNYFCRTDSYWGYVLGSQIQSTIQNVSAEKYANMFLPVPSIEEQQLVIAFLDQATSKIDDLVTEARTAITLLQERRTALISAAVTGQIDVRSIASREVA
ncbi:restriction endonuclease subunit S [Acidovorax sp. D2M1]|uniref:Restriction endonuclease subunit S n=1 Tax=Acidovorax benzenivorans TaxID=2987520 RepID=A0ABT5RWF8_9BURK|nr:restriction endonuclease subunit S [Acidovorax benzenivorans]MDD2177715.1 restriction endonuclease subunit S [Acidovorax benzenivorans]